MTNYRRHDWPALLKAFEQSDQNQAAFCKAHDLNPKYFNQKLNKQKREQSTVFAKVEVENPTTDVHQALVLEVGRCKIVCPHTMPLQSFVQLVHQLA